MFFKLKKAKINLELHIPLIDVEFDWTSPERCKMETFFWVETEYYSKFQKIYFREKLAEKMIV